MEEALFLKFGKKKKCSEVVVDCISSKSQIIVTELMSMQFSYLSLLPSSLASEHFDFTSRQNTAATFIFSVQSMFFTKTF